MTLDEANTHIGNPVLIRTSQGRVADAEIVAADEATGLVQVRVRRSRSPYDWLPGRQWWHPAHLSVPQWWLDREKVGTSEIEQLIEASSLGTSEAKALRARVPDETARAIVERSKQIGEEDQHDQMQP